MNNQISFLNFRHRPTKVKSFLNAPLTKMQTPGLFKKESIRGRRLSKYGDADMDGSINFFDCDPRRVNRDGIFDSVGKIFSRGKSKTTITRPTAQRYINEVSREEGREKFKKGVSRTSRSINSIVSKGSRGFAASLGAPSLNINPVSGRFSKESIRSQRRIQGRTLKAVQLLSPPGTLQSPSGRTGTGRKGRPRGPSGKYFIPGVGSVGVYEYRNWLRRQRKVSRLKMREGSPVATADTNSLRTSAMQQRQTYQSETPQEDNEDIAMESSEQFEELPQQRLSSTVQMQTPVGTDGMDNTQLLQLQMQQRDNILNAPQFMKGQLTNTSGGSIIDERGRPNILQAPNAFLGQLRNLQAKNPVELGEKPITNPYGDYFTTIDPISGKPILQKRVREKWLTGEAI